MVTCCACAGATTFLGGDMPSQNDLVMGLGAFGPEDGETALRSLKTKGTRAFPLTWRDAGEQGPSALVERGRFTHQRPGSRFREPHEDLVVLSPKRFAAMTNDRRLLGASRPRSSGRSCSTCKLDGIQCRAVKPHICSVPTSTDGSTCQVHHG